jgi:hypothetical protein
MTAPIRKVLSWDKKPARLQTKTGWTHLGWRVRPDVPPVTRMEIYVQNGRGTWLTYPYQSVEPIPGARAAARRQVFMLGCCVGVGKGRGAAWVNGFALIGLLTAEQIQDAAYASVHQPLDGLFFADQIPALPLNLLHDRLRWGFELGALDALGRSYADYPYNEF